MKKFLTATLLLLLILTTITSNANMAAPALNDIASGITFEKNDAVAVVNEILDITINGSYADIRAAYTMKNTTDTAVSTPVMFLSPDIEGDTAVTARGEAIAHSSDTYALTYSSSVTSEDWRFAVLTDTEAVPTENPVNTVAAINFTLDFASGEEYEVVVSYKYKLGGYPEYDFDAKMGTLEYYLSPAKLWRSFNGLTINLTLGEDMPKLTRSNIEFERVGARQYRYTIDARSSSVMPDKLEISVDESPWQSALSSLRSPYLMMNLMMLLPIILPIAAIVVVVIVVVVRRRKG